MEMVGNGDSNGGHLIVEIAIVTFNSGDSNCGHIIVEIAIVDI